MQPPSCEISSGPLGEERKSVSRLLSSPNKLLLSLSVSLFASILHTHTHTHARTHSFFSQTTLLADGHDLSGGGGGFGGSTGVIVTTQLSQLITSKSALAQSPCSLVYLCVWGGGGRSYKGCLMCVCLYYNKVNARFGVNCKTNAFF